MRTTGTISEKYLALARPSGRLSPKDTELYGRFQDLAGAIEEQSARGGKIVEVKSTLSWSPASDHITTGNEGTLVEIFRNTPTA